MWELSKNHCCATCLHSRKPGSLVETSPPASYTGRVTEESLFPLSGNRLCAYCRESLGQPSVQGVLVRPDGRCEAYECDENRYFSLHGTWPQEDEDLYGLSESMGACLHRATGGQSFQSMV